MINDSSEYSKKRTRTNEYSPSLDNSPQSRRVMAKPTPKKAKGDNLDDLKQELDIDFHKISPEELYQRFQTHPENVSVA